MIRSTRVSAYAVCSEPVAGASDVRVLLARWVAPDGRRRWTLPGGGLDPGEHPEQAAVRELAEETGLAVRLERLVGVEVVHHVDAERDAYGVGVIYRADVVGGTLRPEEDGSTDLSAWVPVREVTDLDRVPLVDAGLRTLEVRGWPLAPMGSSSAVGGGLVARVVVRVLVDDGSGRVVVQPEGADLPGVVAEHGEALADAAARAIRPLGLAPTSEPVPVTATLDGGDLRVTLLAAVDGVPRSGVRWCSPGELGAAGMHPAAVDAVAVLVAGA